MFINVDLPAPFSPRIAWISPRSTLRVIASLATSAPKDLVIARNSTDTNISPFEKINLNSEAD